MTDYYDHGGAPADASYGDSAVIRAEFTAIQNGISKKLPVISGNPGKIIAVNAGATKLEAVATTGTGAVVRSNNPALVAPTGLVKGDVGLGNVDNTSDADKPVSTAQATAIGNKANKGANNDITSLSGLTTALSIAQGGTGGTSQAAAQAALGVYSKSEVYTKTETDTKLDNPAFSAYISADQTITSSTYTKSNFDTEEFDIGNCYDTTNKRWTPNKAGYYCIGGFFNTYSTTGMTVDVISLYKNGVAYKQIADIRGGATGVVGGSTLIYMNGTTDYVEIYAYIGATTPTIVGGATLSGFYGYFVRS